MRKSINLLLHQKSRYLPKEKTENFFITSFADLLHARWTAWPVLHRKPSSARCQNLRHNGPLSKWLYDTRRAAERPGMTRELLSFDPKSETLGILASGMVMDDLGNMCTCDL